MLNAFLVDDEELSLIELQYILKKFSNVNICGTASSGKEALKKIASLKPNVVFLDIHLHDLDGIKIAETIRNLHIQNIKIIFVTAYEEYALKAFELNAVDYLLKPFSEDRIKVTLDRLLTLDIKDNYQHLNSIEKLQKITVELNGKLKLIDLDEIIFIEAQGRNTIFYIPKIAYHTNYSLKILEDKLANYYFFKPHRSFLINLKKIEEIIPWFNSTYQLIMEYYPDKKIPVTRANTKAFKKIVGIQGT